MSVSAVRNLLFDLGNVIVDLDIDGCTERLRRLMKADASIEEFNIHLIKYESGRISSELFINRILALCSHKVQALDVIEAWNSMLVGIPGHRLDMLKKLRERYNVYLLSNTNELHLEWIHRHVKSEFGIQDFESAFFDQAYYSHLVGDRKPMPSIFKHIIEDAFMTPALTLYMDDVQENLDAASLLGFQTYLVRPGEEIKEYLRETGLY